MPRHPTSQVSLAPPDGVKELLTDAVYADVATLVVGAASTLFIAAICWARSGASLPLAIGVCVAISTLARVAIARLRRRRRRAWHDRVFAIFSVLYMFLVGMLTFWAFAVSDDPFMLTMTSAVSVINMMSVALRFFALERFVITHMIAVTIPVVAIFISRGGLFWIAAAMEILLPIFVFKTAERLRAILVSEMRYRRRSDQVASRFRFAVDNMSHGMCMIDGDRRIVVSNAELAECFGAPAGRSLQGVRFAALVRLARRKGAMSPQDVNRLMSIFAADSVTRLEAAGPNGRVQDFTLKRNDDGGWVLVVQDVTDQRQAREALDRAARFDPMTDLPNRRSFEEKLAGALDAARGLDTRTEALFLDLDGFKQVNDTLGHKFGDRVLAEASRRLRFAIAGESYVARWGGDEFVILRSGPDDEALLEFADRLIADLSRPMWIEGTQVVVGASLGAAICVGGAIGVEALLQQADMALYAAKREARGCCRIYRNSMSEQAQERRLLELDLQAALAARTFELHYQPIVDIETGELVSFEALARWRHPTRGNVSPEIFVPVLEDLNLMTSFGSWALQRACDDAAQWPIPARVGVNVSTRQIDGLYDMVRRALATSGLAPGRLELEITETAALAAPDAACRVLESVRALGVRVALDDFGTGYSSLSHLMRLPLDKVKIDKSFTKQLGVSRKADVLVANIARISSQLGMRVTFEGVETTEQLDRARALGVMAEGQGWLFGKPTPNSELDRVFAMEMEKDVA